MILQTECALDPEVAAFVEKSMANTPEDAVTLDAGGQRRLYDQMCASFGSAVPGTVQVTDGAVAAGDGGREIPVRRYRPAAAPADALILYMHGGGFVVGGLDSHHGVCAELCDAAGCDLIALDYRLAPEFTHPAQFEDCLAAFLHYARSYRRIVLAGDSAGGNLAAALCVATLASGPKPAGAVLIYPALGGDQLDLPSYSTMAEAPMLSTRDVHGYHLLWHGGPQARGDARSAPLLAEHLTGHPPTAIFSAEIDPLCDDGKTYERRLRAAGVPATCRTEPGLVHGYLRARTMSARAGDSFRRICAAAKALVEHGTLPDPQA